MTDSGFGDTRGPSRRELANESRARDERFGGEQLHSAHVAIVCVVAALFACGAAGCEPQTTKRATNQATTDVSEADFVALDRYRQPDKVLAAMPTLESAWVADVGAGGGYFALRLARRVGERGHVVATDIDGDALVALRARADKAGIDAARLETRRVSPTDPQLEASRYAVILLSEVDHLLVNRVDYFRKLRSALRAGGVVVIVNHERYRDPCRAALVEAGFVVEVSADAPPGQLLFRGR